MADEDGTLQSERQAQYAYATEATGPDPEDRPDKPVETFKQWLKEVDAETRLAWYVGAVIAITDNPYHEDVAISMNLVAAASHDAEVQQLIRDNKQLDGVKLHVPVQGVGAEDTDLGRSRDEVSILSFDNIDVTLENMAPDQLQLWHDIAFEYSGRTTDAGTAAILFSAFLMGLPIARATQIGFGATRGTVGVGLPGSPMGAGVTTARLATAARAGVLTAGKGGLFPAVSTGKVGQFFGAKALQTGSYLAGKTPAAIQTWARNASTFYGAGYRAVPMLGKPASTIPGAIIRGGSHYTLGIGGMNVFLNSLANYVYPEEFSRAEATAALGPYLERTDAYAQDPRNQGPYPMTPGVSAMGVASVAPGIVDAAIGEGGAPTGASAAPWMQDPGGYPGLGEAMGIGEIDYEDDPYVGFEGEFPTEDSTVPKWWPELGPGMHGPRWRVDAVPEYKSSDIKLKVDNMTPADLVAFQTRLILAGYVDPENERYDINGRNQQDYAAMADLMGRANRDPDIRATWESMLTEQIRINQEKDDEEHRQPFRYQAYVRPDPAALNMTVRDWSRSNLGRDANEWEIALGRAEMLKWDRQNYDNFKTAAYQDWKTTGRLDEWDPPEGAEEEDWPTFEDTPVQEIDAGARFAEMFESKFGKEISRKKRTDLVHSKTQNLMAGLNRTLEAFR